MREPTFEEIEANAEVDADGRRGFAAWYPSMGGYVGKCVIVPDLGEDGVDVYVWHDGSFPFSDEWADEGRDGKPTVLHHCSPDAFIQFGQLCERLGRVVTGG